MNLPPLRVTQEQPAHFAPLRDDEWPSFVHHRDNEFGVYGLATPGEGIKVGFHGLGPVVDPDERDFRPEPGQLKTLRDYAREWLPGVDPDAYTPISCTYTTTPTSDFVLDRVGPVVVAAGFSGHGFKFVPAVGRVLRRSRADRRAPGRPVQAGVAGSVFAERASPRRPVSSRLGRRDRAITAAEARSTASTACGLRLCQHRGPSASRRLRQCRSRCGTNTSSREPSSLSTRRSTQRRTQARSPLSVAKSRGPAGRAGGDLSQGSGNLPPAA